MTKIDYPWQNVLTLNWDFSVQARYVLYCFVIDTVHVIYFGTGLKPKLNT